MVKKVLSVMLIFFLTPGEPLFMGKGNGKNTAMNIAKNLYNALGGEDGGQGLSNSEKDGRYYTFAQSFPEYKKYANTALRALAFYMGIQDISVPVPGTNEDVQLSKIDIEEFLSNDFVKIFGTQCSIPFYLDAETSFILDIYNLPLNLNH